MGKKMRDIAGFTLAELLIVVAIVMVLVAIAIPVFSSSVESSKRAVDVSNAREAKALLAAAVNDGTIKFEDSNSAVWVYACKDRVVYEANGSKKFPIVNGVQSSSSDQQVKKLFEDAGLTEDQLKVVCDQPVDTGSVGSDEGWTWYCVYITGTGAIGAVSGPGDVSSWKRSPDSWGWFASDCLYSGSDNSAMARALKGQ